MYVRCLVVFAFSFCSLFASLSYTSSILCGFLQFFFINIFLFTDQYIYIYVIRDN